MFLTIVHQFCRQQLDRKVTVHESQPVPSESFVEPFPGSD